MNTVISEKINKIEKSLEILSENSEKLEGKIDVLSSFIESSSFCNNMNIDK